MNLVTTRRGQVVRQLLINFLYNKRAAWFLQAALLRLNFLEF